MGCINIQNVHVFLNIYAACIIRKLNSLLICCNTFCIVMLYWGACILSNHACFCHASSLFLGEIITIIKYML
jgi:hypothetical protein